MRWRKWWWAALLVAAACGGAPASDGADEILDRLDRIEARLRSIEDRTSAVPEPIAAAAPVPAPGDAADPFAPPAAPAGKSLAIAVTRAGWRVDDREIDEAQLRLILRGVASVTVRAEPDAPAATLTELVDLLHEADIARVAIARFSAVQTASVEP